MAAGRITVSRVAVPAAAATAIDARSPERSRLVLKVVSGGPVYIGDSAGVTTGNGYPLASGDQPLALEATEGIHVITAATITADLAVIEEEI